MEKTIKLKEVIDALEAVASDVTVYWDTVTGELIPTSDREMQLLKDGSAPEALENDSSREQMKAIAEDSQQRFVQLPRNFKIHEWEIMRSFCTDFSDEVVSLQLQQAIQDTGGAAALVKFQECLTHYKIEDNWNLYRLDALRNIAVKWCQENEVEFND